MNETYAAYLDQLSTNDCVKLENSVMLNRRPSGVAITLHQTDIITFTPEGQVVLKNGGWKTTMTCQKPYLPNGWQIKSKNGEWFVVRGETTIPFEEGLEIAL